MLELITVKNSDHVVDSSAKNDSDAGHLLAQAWFFSSAGASAYTI